MTPFRRATVLAISALTLATGLVACASDHKPVDVSTACAVVTTGDGVPVCSELWTSGEALRLPTAEDSVVGALMRGGKYFVTGDGTRYQVRDEARRELLKDNAYATTVYQAVVNRNAVTSVRPVLVVPEDVVISHALGGSLLVGTITPYGGDGEYAEDASLPVAIALATSAENGRLGGTILNATSGVALSDGTCMPALAAAGPANPLQSTFSSAITLERMPSMHADFDDELVLAWTPDSTGMGQAFYPSVATLLGRDAVDESGEMTQHGTPGSGPTLDLSRASATVDPSRTCA